jgi:DNA invertase Pin-like site-specific DNA recombinase
METKVKKTKRTSVIFCRCSSSGAMVGRQDTSRQVADLEAYAKYANLEVVKIFEEHISGAKRNNERPILQEAIEFCKHEHIDYLLCNSLDRIGRNAFEVLETVKDLIDNKFNL